MIPNAGGENPIIEGGGAPGDNQTAARDEGTALRPDRGGAADSTPEGRKGGRREERRMPGKRIN